MTWFKTDDAFWRHRKIRKLGKDKLPAVGLWQLAGSWCADNIDENLSDGFVPREQIEQWDPKGRYAGRLVEVGLWHDAEFDGEHGFRFHDWAEYQKTRAEVEAEREEWRAKKRRTRRGKVSPGDTSGDTARESREESTKESRESPGTRSRPRTRSSDGGHLGEGHSPRHRASGPPAPENLEGLGPRPADRCQRHTGDEHPPPCGNCADARRAAEAWDLAEVERAEAIRSDVEAAIADPRQRCEHGTDGGRFTHPRTGKSATCALCRRTPTREAS